MIKRALLALLPCMFVATGANAKEPDRITLDAGTRIGVVNALGSRFVHYHVGKTIAGNSWKEYEVDWEIPARVQRRLAEGVAARNYEAVIVEPTPSLQERTDNIFGDQNFFALTKAPSGKLLDELKEVAVAERLDAILFVAAERTDSVTTSGSLWSMQAWTFPDLVSHWGVATRASLFGKGLSPVVFSAAVIVLVDLRGEKPDVVSIVAGRQDAIPWKDFQWPNDIKDVTIESIGGARPILDAMFDRLVDKSLETLGEGLANPLVTQGGPNPEG